MPPTVSCHSLEDLKQLVGRALPAEEVDGLAQHLETCDTCAGAVDRLLAEDTISDAIRAQSTLPDAPPPQVVETLIRKLQGLAAPAPADTTISVDSPPSAEMPTHVTGTPGQASAEVYDFLAPPEAADELGRLGGYRILKALRAGGMGVVFQAEDPKLKRRVALKAMLPVLAASSSAGKRFLREAQSMAAVEHDHIVRVYQVGKDHNVPFLAMEFLQGEPLDSRLEKEPRLPLAEVLRIGREIAEGLAAAHEHGLIHRDIKPSNVWLESKKARVKILDFGLARAVGEEAHVTQEGAIIGTPAYMAPEQAASQSIDHRCDLWALGVVLYRLTTGQLPFKGTDAISTLMEVSTANPPTPRQIAPETPEALSDLVMRLLAKNPDNRPQSAQEVAESLQRIELATQAAPIALTSRTAEATPSSGATPLPRRARRKLLALVAGMFLAAALTIAGVFVFRVNTPEGEFIVEAADDSVAVAIDKQGGLQLIHRKTGKEYLVQARRSKKLPTGEYDLVVTDPTTGFEFSAQEVAIKTQGQASVRVTFRKRPAPPLVIAPSPFDAFDAAQIPASERFEGQPRELVGVLVDADNPKRYTQSLAVTSDGRWIASAGSFFSLHFWDTTKRQLATEPGRRENVNTLAVGPNHLLASGGMAGTIKLWDTSGTQVREIAKLDLGAQSGGMPVTLSHDGRFLAAGVGQSDQPNEVRLWKLGDGEPKEWASLAGHTDYLHGLAFSPDSKWLASVGRDRSLRIWDVLERKEIKALNVPRKLTQLAFHAAAFTQDGRTLIAGTAREVHFWDTATWEVRSLETASSHASALTIAPNGRTFLCGKTKTNGPCQLWDIPTGKLLAEWTFPDGVRAVAYSPDSRHALLACANGRTYILRLVSPFDLLK